MLSLFGAIPFPIKKLKMWRLKAELSLLFFLAQQALYCFTVDFFFFNYDK